MNIQEFYLNSLYELNCNELKVILTFWYFKCLTGLSESPLRLRFSSTNWRLFLWLTCNVILPCPSFRFPRNTFDFQHSLTRLKLFETKHVIPFRSASGLVRLWQLLPEGTSTHDSAFPVIWMQLARTSTLTTWENSFGLLHSGRGRVKPVKTKRCFKGCTFYWNSSSSPPSSSSSFFVTVVVIVIVVVVIIGEKKKKKKK